MSIFGEFHFPADAFVLHRTLEQTSDLVVEFERIVVDEERLAPYIWVRTSEPSAFEERAIKDPCVEALERLDAFGTDSLYRVDWAADTSPLVDLVTDVDAVVLEASADRDHWELRIRFDDREQVVRFQRDCDQRDITFLLQRLYSPSEPMTGGQYGLTDKQQEALVVAWEVGYFDSPRDVTLEDVAAELGITRQSLSQRLRRANYSLIGNTLIITPPTSDGEP